MRPELISPAYLEQQRGLHATGRFGGKGGKWASTAMDLMHAHKCETVLDYGCGQGQFGNEMRMMGVDVAEYDPAIRGKEASPEPADLVMCTDVLEHIEPDKIDGVLAHIRSLTRNVAFFVIHTKPASKNLPDGRNAHILLRSPRWWSATVAAAGFSFMGSEETKKHLIYTCK